MMSIQCSLMSQLTKRMPTMLCNVFNVVSDVSTNKNEVYYGIYFVL